MRLISQSCGEDHPGENHRAWPGLSRLSVSDAVRCLDLFV